MAKTKFLSLMFSLRVTFAADWTSHIKNQPLFKQNKQQNKKTNKQNKTNKQTKCVCNESRVILFTCCLMTDVLP